MHIMADLSNEKFSLHLSKCNVELYCLPCFSANREASLLYTTEAMLPIPPATEVLAVAGYASPDNITSSRGVKHKQGPSFLRQLFA